MPRVGLEDELEGAGAVVIGALPALWLGFAPAADDACVMPALWLGLSSLPVMVTSS